VGTTAFDFTVSPSSPSGFPVTVDFDTADGSATTADNDYQAASGTVAFAPGDTSETITVNVNGDTTFEPDESFFVNLSNPQFATIADGQGEGTILNDDAQPTISIDDVAEFEGNAGTTDFVFTVSLSNASYQTITVDFDSADGSATVAGGDYIAASGTVTFLPGDTSETLTVAVNGDTAVEADETFFVNLSNPQNATIADGQGVGTILNDDLSADVPCTITGTNKDDVLVGTPGNDVICGLNGDDEIDGMGGHDVLIGGNGQDSLNGGDGNDLLVGGNGKDDLQGGSGNDNLQGGNGADNLIGGGGSDALFGEHGPDALDTVDGVSGNDSADGGSATDTCATDPGDITVSCP
jgi:Ca2+-binding RTX toxin-like protein